ncbi:MAG TPA: TonB-dependent receptor [Candidatus Acidoferrales bacterium]|nr:TonB-dependent receptor [Candidatus Acidoferrales bacterium]
MILGVLLLSVPAFSQGSTGRILGTITDTSRGVVSGATITVIDTERGVTRTITSDDAGEYNAPNLTPSTYTVRVEAKGFKKLDRQNVVIEVGKEIRVDLTLQPGAQEQTVVVTEAVPLVETTNATLGGALDNADINNMPLNGRNYQLLLALRPGVMVQPGGGPWTQSTNGIRPDESAWMVDGVINANFYDARPILGMSSPITDGATILPIDAIQEFNTMENPKAESGWKPGAIVNVGIKSGTNQLHGSAYAFGRTDAWSARNTFNVVPTGGVCPTSPFLAGCDKTPTQLKQFGGVVGGPIKKDKLFFFGGYEGLRSFIGNAFAAKVPETSSQATANPKKSMVDAINCLAFPSAATCGAATVPSSAIPISAASLKLTGCTMGANASATACKGYAIGQPSLTGAFWPDNGSSSTGFFSNFPNVNQSDNGIGKIDFHLNDKNTIMGLLGVSRYNGDGEDHTFINPLFNDTFVIRTWTTTENWIYTPSSNVVNEVRFGYNRMSFPQINDDAGATNPLNTGLTVLGLPNIKMSGFTTFGTQHNRPSDTSPNPYYDIQESVSYLKGKHTLKFGGEWAHIDAGANVPDLGRGLFDINGNGAFPKNGALAGSTPLEDLFAGTPTDGVALVGNAARQMTWTSTAVFGQDDWRITPRLTVNLGLRYSYASPIREVNNLWANFDPSSPTGLIQQGAQGAPTLWRPDYKDLSPRVGFAWDVTGKGSTVVRGGFSIMYSTFTAVMWLNQGVFQNSTAVSIAANPTGATTIVCPGSSIGAAGAGTCGGGLLNLPGPVATPGDAKGIQLGSATHSPSSLCWDPTITSGPAFTAACAASQTTVFPAGSLQCGDLIGSDPSPCNLLGVDPNLKTPYVENFNFGIQHAFTNNLSLEVSYVGNIGKRLTGFNDINQPAVGAGYCLNATPTIAQKADACAGGPLALGSDPKVEARATQEGRPYFAKFPFIGFINQMTNASRSNYNSLQATLTKRMSHGLSFIAGYTYAHGLDSGSLNRFALIPQNAVTGEAGQYSDSDFDVRHRFTFTTTYDIPGIKGFAQLLEGWQINSIISVQSSQPWIANDYVNNFSGTFDNADRWNFTGNRASMRGGVDAIPYCLGGVCTITSSLTGAPGPTLSNSSTLWGDCVAQAADPTTLGAAGCYASASGDAILTPNALGAFGNMGRNIFRDSGFKDMDFSVFKNFRFKERYGVQFRAEVFNLFNHPVFANPYGASSNFGGKGNNNDLANPGGFGGSPGTPDVAAGNNVVGSGAARDIQLGLKLTF